jgi:hypothetical protein
LGAFADSRRPSSTSARLECDPHRRQLAALVIAIATINAFNRINATTRQITGDWAREWVEHSQHAEQAA